MSERIEVKIIDRSGNELPQYATPGSAGMDIRAHLAEPLLLLPMQRQMVPTGIFLAIPAGYECQVRPRSGLAVKHGITCLNTPGTIDADYRGEVNVILINLGADSYTIQPGERIAQLVFAAVSRVEWHETDVLEETGRGAGGFGHTGVK